MMRRFQEKTCLVAFGNPLSYGIKIDIFALFVSSDQLGDYIGASLDEQ
jgi:hypothetical protein